jgi:hypothetical protein
MLCWRPTQGAPDRNDLRLPFLKAQYAELAQQVA